MRAVAGAWFVAIGVSCLGCHHEAKGENKIPDAAPDSVAVECVRPLAESCAANVTCPTFDSEAQKLRALVARYNDSGCLQTAQIGECGTFRVVAQSDGYVARTEYFDKSGALIGVKASSDTNEYCNGKAFGATYGSVPQCTLHVTEDLCPGAR